MNDPDDPKDKPDRPDAAGYVLGLSDAPDTPDTAFDSAVQAWADRLLPLDADAEQDTPAGLWDAIAQQIDTAPGIRTVDRDDGIWEQLGDGLHRKIVHADATAGRISYFLKLDKGARLPEHDHPGDEHCVVLEGSLRIGSRVFGAGAYQFAASGLPHPVVIAETDVMVFINGPI